MFNFFEKHKTISWIFTILIAIFIFYISSLKFEQAPIIPGWDVGTIVYHFSIFFLLALFLLPSLVRGKKKNLIFIGIIIAIFYGIADEFHQLFVPGRFCSPVDFLIDSSGILLAGFLYSLSLRLRKL